MSWNYTITDRVGVEVITSSSEESHILDMVKLEFVMEANLIWYEDVDELSCSNEDSPTAFFWNKRIESKEKEGGIRIANVTALVREIGFSSFKITHDEHPTSWCLIIVYNSHLLPVRTVALQYGDGVESFYFPTTIVPPIKTVEGRVIVIGRKEKHESSYLLSVGADAQGVQPVFMEVTPSSNGIQWHEADISPVLRLGQQSIFVKKGPQVPNENFSSTICIVEVVSPQPLLDMFQVTDKASLKVGEFMNYYTHIINRGTGTAERIRFRTNIPQGTIMQIHNLTINDVLVPLNPADGIILRNMPVNDYLLVKYTIYVQSMPTTGKLLHHPVLDYNFSPAPGVVLGCKTPCRNVMETLVD